jgi:guanylate kinase
VIVNDDLERALHEIIAILAAERLKRTRQIGLSEFVRHVLNDG